MNTSLVTEKYLVAQIDTALVRAAYQGAVVEFATNTTLVATEFRQSIEAINARLPPKNGTAPVAVDLSTTESVRIPNESRLKLWRITLDRPCKDRGWAISMLSTSTSGRVSGSSAMICSLTDCAVPAKVTPGNLGSITSRCPTAMWSTEISGLPAESSWSRDTAVALIYWLSYAMVQTTTPGY